MALSSRMFVRKMSSSAASKSSSGLPPAIEAMNNATRGLLELQRKLDHAKHHGPAGERRWRFLSLFVATPIIALVTVQCYLDHVNHPHERRPFKPYEHLYIRTKKFPWRDGNKPLFYNPKYNPLPGIGYEDEQE